jgi:hypothetical protein
MRSPVERFRKSSYEWVVRSMCAVTLLGVAFAGCFNPNVKDGGFACNMSDNPPCPTGFECVDGLCLRPGEVPHSFDMQGSGGNGGSGGGGGHGGFGGSGGGGGGGTNGGHDMAHPVLDMAHGDGGSSCGASGAFCTQSSDCCSNACFLILCL